jgi:hypothetical protein
LPETVELPQVYLKPLLGKGVGEGLLAGLNPHINAGFHIPAFLTTPALLAAGIQSILQHIQQMSQPGNHAPILSTCILHFNRILPQYALRRYHRPG